MYLLTKLDGNENQVCESHTLLKLANETWFPKGLQFPNFISKHTISLFYQVFISRKLFLPIKF